MYKLIITFISIALLCMPFIWFRPGEMDLGGDNSRLYFYEPISYLNNYAFYAVSPSSLGNENIGFFMTPFVYFLYLLMQIFSSPTMLIASFHGMSFSIAFLSVYFTVKNLLQIRNSESKYIYDIAAVVAGLFYIFSPLTIYGWDKVLSIHNQFFLNPLVFFLFLMSP